MDKFIKRQQDIIQIITNSGFATIDQLAQKFNVTPQTIRSDINYLCAQKILTRYHGGATLGTGSQANTAWQTRQNINRHEKELIAEYIAQNIPDGSCLFMNLGTTTEIIAQKLLQYKNKLTLITNNLNIAIQLAGKKDFDILVAGGSMRHSDRGVVGQEAIDFVSQFHADTAIIGISGISENGTLSDFDYQEVQVAKSLIRNANNVILACDSSKFGIQRTVKMGSFEKIDQLVTDQQPPENITKEAQKNNCQITVVSKK